MKSSKVLKKKMQPLLAAYDINYVVAYDLSLVTFFGQRFAKLSFT